MQVRRRDALASRTVRFEYTVSGTGRFPLDMLRYDGSYPASSQDANTITDSLDPELAISDEAPARWRVNLVTSQAKAWLPTQARWASFGWRVE